jgi:hypothetical protein
MRFMTWNVHGTSISIRDAIWRLQKTLRQRDLATVHGVVFADFHVRAYAFGGAMRNSFLAAGLSRHD